MATPVTVSALPDTATAARVESDEAARYSSESRSGSMKYGTTSTVRTLSTSSSRSSIMLTASGARFGTVTAKLCVAVRPSGSRAVTVIEVWPAATPVTVSMLPDTVAAAIAGSVETAV